LKKLQFRNWQSVQEEVLRRNRSCEWKPGDLIPNEAAIAEEFGCARATVNRALRELAETGLLEQRRKAGTRVLAQPVAKATLDISVIRMDVEARGQRHANQLIARAEAVPPAAISGAMGGRGDSKIASPQGVHLADGLPYALEDRWINTRTVPDALDEALMFCCAATTALSVIDRTTWNSVDAVTKVRIVFAQGHQMQAVI
jgi:GntR family histidine utilization transcriptional repressor